MPLANIIRSLGLIQSFYSITGFNKFVITLNNELYIFRY